MRVSKVTSKVRLGDRRDPSRYDAVQVPCTLLFQLPLSSEESHYGHLNPSKLHIHFHEHAVVPHDSTFVEQLLVQAAECNGMPGAQDAVTGICCQTFAVERSLVVR